MEFKDFKKKFVEQLIDEDEEAISEETAFRELSSWDSLTAMAVIAMVEDDYKVKIPDNDFRKFNIVNDIFLYIRNNSK